MKRKWYSKPNTRISHIQVENLLYTVSENIGGGGSGEDFIFGAKASVDAQDTSQW